MAKTSGSVVRAFASTTIAAGAVAGRRPRASSSLADGADPDQRHVAGDQPAVGQAHAGDLAVLRPRRPAIVGAELEGDAAGLVIGAEEVARAASQATRARMRGSRLDHHRLGAERAGRGRRLQADIAAADHRQPLAGPERGLQRLGVGRRAQRRARRRRSAPGMGSGRAAAAGGEDQGVVGEALAVRERAPSWPPRSIAADRDVQASARCRLRRRSSPACSISAVGVGLALQPGLGERRALIGGDRLVADEPVSGPRSRTAAARPRPCRRRGPRRRS